MEPEGVDMSGSFQLWVDTVRGITGPTEELSMLDLCCGEMSATRLLKWKSVTAVDVMDYPGRPQEFLFIQSNVLDIEPSLFSAAGGFDVCVCSDGLEHFARDDGHRLLCRMAEWSELPIIFTPTGESSDKIDPRSTHPDTHKSSWTQEDFHSIGWETMLFPNWHPTIGLGAIFGFRRTGHS
jgi:hypothetical protein